MKPDLVIVFGASGAIGGAIATAAAERGYPVTGFDMYAVDRPGFRVHEMDATDSNQVEASFDKALRETSGEVVVVNAVGAPGRGRIVDIDESEFDRVLDLNLRTAFLVTQALLNSLLSGKCSTAGIVHLASGSGSVGSEDRFAYSVAKAGLLGLCRQVSMDFKNEQFSIVAISPGLVDTEFATPMLNPVEREDYRRRRALALSPAGVAELALWLINHGMPRMSGASVDLF